MTNLYEPLAWPYDNPLPVGLPKLASVAGKTLGHVLGQRPGNFPGVSVKLVRSDNEQVLVIYRAVVSAVPLGFQYVGKHIDRLA